MFRNRARGVRIFSIVAAAGSLAVAAVAVPAQAFAPAHNVAPRLSVKIHSSNETSGRVRIVVKASDADSKRLRIHAPKRTAKGHLTWQQTKIANTTGALTYTPTPTARHQAASDTATTQDVIDSFTVTVRDGEGGRTSIPVAVAIAPSNATPTGAASVGVPDAGTGVVTGAVGASDPEGDPLIYTAAPETSKGSVSVSASTGAFTYTPTATARTAAGQPGATQSDTTDTFTVTVSDGHGGNLAVPVSVAVAPLAG